MPIENPEGFRPKQETLIVPASNTPERNMLLTALSNKELAKKIEEITREKFPMGFPMGSDAFHTLVEAAERLKSNG